MPREIPRYTCRFLSRRKVIELAERYHQEDVKNEYTDNHCIEAGRILSQCRDSQCGDARAHLRIVYRWKLQAFRSRFRWVDRFPEGLTDEEICHALAPARSLGEHLDQSKIAYALRALCCLPGVGIPTASAVLMAMHPQYFTVIDRQAYNCLGVDFREPLSPEEYVAYVDFCRSRAKDLRVCLKQYDQALWMCGKLNGIIDEE